MEQLVKIFLLLAIIKAVACQELISPCPRLFKYEPKNNDEPDRWYGQITLLSESQLSGVWLRVIFDKPTIQLGNWFGEVSTEDNKEYLIKNRNHKLLPNTPSVVRFYVKYDTKEAPPRLSFFRLNAKTVCPEGGVVTEAPSTMGQLLTSSELSTTSSPFDGSRPNINQGDGDVYIRPGGGYTDNQNSDDDDFFHGDFALLGKPQRPVLDHTCGTVIKQPKPLITYGQVTHEGEFPWHAAIYHARGIDLTYICGASLISQYHLITVAHCVTRRKTQSPLPPSSLVIYLGKFYLKIWSNPGIQDKHVEKIIVHQKYNSQSFNNDLAIMKLSTPVKISDYVRPVCMWEGQTSLDAVIGKAGTVAGWGFDETGKVTEQLTKAHMPVVSQETCIYSYPISIRGLHPSKHFAQVSKMYVPGPRIDTGTGTSVCNGDSGGGMVFPKPGANSNYPVWQLRGMVSISVALQNQFKCDASHYVVFTDIAKYLDWIKMALTL